MGIENFFKKEEKPSNHNPTRTIMLGFFTVICIGALLLNLPFASQDGKSVGFLDAFFTATSAVCVTGLTVVNTLNHWTAFGKIVIITLIQIGGLGFMTVVTLVLILARKKITLKERILIQESLNQNSIEGMVRLVVNIIRGTILIETIGAVFLALCFIPTYGVIKGILYGVFHSISAFCNAGFDLLGESSLSPYVGNLPVNLIVMSLIVLGGLGFTVWIDLLKSARLKRNNRLDLRYSLRKLTLHSKIVLSMTVFLICGGAFFFFICEYSNPNTMGNLPFGSKIIASFMQSVTARTAGFFSIDQLQMNYASKLMTIILMFIGGSPAGTAGGIKTVTLSVLVIAVISVIKGSDTTHCYGKNIPFDILQKALAIFFISLSVVMGITMILTFTEKNSAFSHEFIDLLYETVSALGTVGTTTGITPHLSVPGRIVICIAMFMGRVGPISIAMGLTRKKWKNKNLINYPEERVLVG